MPGASRLTPHQTRALLAMADGSAGWPSIDSEPVRNLIRLGLARECLSRNGCAMITALGLYRARIIRQLSRKGVGWGSGGVGSRSKTQKGDQHG